jgi:exopolysaccharide production protein ExoZ
VPHSMGFRKLAHRFGSPNAALAWRPPNAPSLPVLRCSDRTAWAHIGKFSRFTLSLERLRNRMSDGSATRGIFSVQILRAVAALGVVLYHFQLDLQRHLGLTNLLPNLQWGSCGVDLFFVISGFVMVYASEKLFGTQGGSGMFLVRRLIRIVPLYWGTTTIYLVLAITAAHISHKTYSLGMIVTSYLFIPWSSPEGFVEPIVGQGWTLNYEMMFYLVFSIGVGLQRRAAVTVIAAVLVGVVVVGSSVDALPLPVSYWCKPIILEFVFGMLLGIGYLEGLRLPRWVAFALVCTGATLMACAFYSFGDSFSHRELRCGLPAMIIVAGSVFYASPARSSSWLWLAVIGEASYALYLLHAIPIRAVRELSVRTGVDIGAAPWSFLMIDVVLAVILAIVVHYYFEGPLTRVLRASVTPRRTKALELVNT